MDSNRIAWLLARIDYNVKDIRMKQECIDDWEKEVKRLRHAIRDRHQLNLF